MRLLQAHATLKVLTQTQLWFAAMCADVCSDTDTPCYNQVPAEIALKIVSKIKVSILRAGRTDSKVLLYL
jgi:hypothetical protein